MGVSFHVESIDYNFSQLKDACRPDMVVACINSLQNDGDINADQTTKIVLT
jgi:hypothetical protein